MADQESLRDEEEAELKLLVKNVPKKLTYDQSEQVPLDLQGARARALSIGSRNTDQRQAISYNSRESEENAVIRESQAALRNSNVYYELSSSKNDDNESESEPEEDERYSNLPLAKNKNSGIEADDLTRLREKLAENPNFLQQTPPNCNDNFAMTKQQQIIRRQRENPNLYKTGPTKYQDGANKGHWTQAEDE